MKLLKIALYLVGGCVMLPVLLVGLAFQGLAHCFITVADTILFFVYPKDL